MNLPKPYNNYNLFFVLERALIIHGRNSDPPAAAADTCTPSPTATSFLGYDDMDIPPLPPRYQHVASTLPPNWYVPGKNSLVKRKHTKTHGGEYRNKKYVYIVTALLFSPDSRMHSSQYHRTSII